ncbi:MAG: nitrilase-related carbon-nitrogen hydrolase [Candidatus Fermentibacteraceae bacterium]
MSAGGRNLVVRTCELPIRGSWDNCMERAIEACSRTPFPDVSVLPELFTIGFVMDRIEGAAIDLPELADLPLARVARECGTWVIGGSFPVRTPGGIVNTMPVYSPSGVLVHTVEKIHLFKNMREDTAFTGGLPTGVFGIHGITAGAAVCYDLRFPEVFRDLTLGGALILFVAAQWPVQRRKVFRCLLQARSSEAQVFTVGCNLGGDHLGSRFGGGGGVCAPSGDFLKGRKVAAGVTDYELDMTLVDLERKRINCLADRRPETYGTAAEVKK